MKLPQGYKLEDQIIHGHKASHPGLYEIIIHNPSKKNAVGTPPERKMAELLTAANTDDSIKVILLHGGRFFSSGNDLSMFVKPGQTPK